jgi:hypothetical protein
MLSTSAEPPSGRLWFEKKFHLVTYECDLNKVKKKIDLIALARGFPQHTLCNSF